jgi:tripeptide aminopeptidase
MALEIDSKRAISHLMHLLAADGPTGGEGPVADRVIRKLKATGCRDSWIRENQGQRALPPDFSIGNLVVRLPGTVAAPRILFSAHLDTVPLCRGAKPVRRDDRVVPRGRTGLGGDDRAAVALMVALAEALLRQKPPHPPISFLFTVGEETGLHGARAFDPAAAGHPVMAFNLDGGGDPAGVVGALGVIHWEADVVGVSAHAAIDPESGVSAGVIAARAIAELDERGLLGRIRQGRNAGTANIGTLHGGQTVNQVMDSLRVTGECRSDRAVFMRQLLHRTRRTFERSAAKERSREGLVGTVDFRTTVEAEPFRLRRAEPVVRAFVRAAGRVGQTRELKEISACLDANLFNARGLPTITFGAGNHRPHSLDEYVSIPDYLAACRLAAEIATGPEARGA